MCFVLASVRLHNGSKIDICLCACNLSNGLVNSKFLKKKLNKRKLVMVLSGGSSDFLFFRGKPSSWGKYARNVSHWSESLRLRRVSLGLCLCVWGGKAGYVEWPLVAVNYWVTHMPANAQTHTGPPRVGLTTTGEANSFTHSPRIVLRYCRHSDTLSIGECTQLRCLD